MWLEEVEKAYRVPSRRDTKFVMVAGIDIDGQLRGKFVPISKVIDNGRMPFCSVVFGWDLNDEKYISELTISNADNGYKDLTAVLDTSMVYQYPGNLNSTLVLSYFLDDAGRPLHSDPRSLLKNVLENLTAQGLHGMAGAEIEFYNYAETARSANVKSPQDLNPLTTGMHGYSVLRPLQNDAYWSAILHACEQFNISFDTFHSETGPGVYECALQYRDAATMADQVTLFKFAVRSVSNNRGFLPCFMAKPQTGMPGNSGHIHVSLVDSEEKNVFMAEELVPGAPFPEVEYLSETGRHFLAGLLEGLEDVMLMFTPNVNSYKRLDPEFWAPVTVSWGAENRLASVRLIDAKQGAKACRFEVRIPGADMVPHLALAAIYGLGSRGIKNKIPLTRAPVRTQQDILDSPMLPANLPAAIQAFEAKSSLAREIFGDEFVDHYAGTRKHEWAVSQRAVTDWEFKRYVETA